MFFKTEHSIGKLIVVHFCRIRVIKIGMVAVKKFYNAKSAAVNVKMNVALFKIRRDRFPDFNLGMKLFDLTPSCIADAFAVDFRRYKKQIKIAVPAFDSDDYASNLFLAAYNALRRTVIR